MKIDNETYRKIRCALSEEDKVLDFLPESNQTQIYLSKYFINEDDFEGGVSMTILLDKGKKKENLKRLETFLNFLEKEIKSNIDKLENGNLQNEDTNDFRHKNFKEFHTNKMSHKELTDSYKKCL